MRGIDLLAGAVLALMIALLALFPDQIAGML